jgi:hypothetical protein
MVHAILGIRPPATRLDGAKSQDLMDHGKTKVKRQEIDLESKLLGSFLPWRGGIRNSRGKIEGRAGVRAADRSIRGDERSCHPGRRAITHVIPGGAALGAHRAGSANGQVTCTARPMVSIVWSA